jgi:hypothetical protein
MGYAVFIFVITPFCGDYFSPALLRISFAVISLILVFRGIGSDRLPLV